MVIRNWRDARPYVGHENVISHAIFTKKGSEGRTDEEAPLEADWWLVRQMIQGGKSGDEHVHEGAEQVYYFTRGRGKIRLDGKTYEVREGDAVFIPPGCRHQSLNDSDDWLELVIITARVKRA